MKGMKSAKEYFQAPPPGRYLSKIVQAEATISKKSGASMIHLVLEVRQPEDFAGAQAHDYLITDGGAPGGGLAKIKLRGLGIDVDGSDAEIPDSQLVGWLFGTELLVEYGNEPLMSETVKGSGKYDKPVLNFDSDLNREVPAQKLIVKGYYRHAITGTAAGVGATAGGATVTGLPIPVLPTVQTLTAPVPVVNGGTTTAVPPWAVQQPVTQETVSRGGRKTK